MSKQKEQFCIKCGKALPVGSSFCNHCGANQFGASEQAAPAAPTVIYANQAANSIPPFSAFCVAGFVTAIFQLSPFNLIFSIIGVHECKKYGKRGMGLGVFSIIFSLLDIIVITVIMLAILGFSAITLPDGISDYVSKSKEAEESIKEHNEQVETVVDAINDINIDSNSKGSFWDSQTTQTTNADPNVPVDLLSSEYYYYDETDDMNSYIEKADITSDDIDKYGNSYSSGWRLFCDWTSGSPYHYVDVYYQLSSKYSSVTGVIVPGNGFANNVGDNVEKYYANIEIYADDEMIYSTKVYCNSEIENLSLDVSDVDMLRIYVQMCPGYSEDNLNYEYQAVEVLLADFKAQP